MKKIAIGFVILALAIAVFSANAYAKDAQGKVTVSGIAPTITGITLWNEHGADANITMTVGQTGAEVTANATVRDLDGGADITGASATLYLTGSGGESDNENNHASNGTCSITGADTYNRTVTCSFTIGYMATAGTWIVNITAVDDTHSVSGQDENDVSTLLAFDVLEGTIDFGEMSPGENSTTPANVTVQNLGNQVLSTFYKGTNYTCDAVGEIPIGNMKYNNTAGSYTAMTGTAMTESSIQDADFSLAARTGGTNATDSEFFTILIPSSDVAGACTNSVTIDATAP
jgi:hypothetical protein